VLAIVTTHPIQYQTPIWQALAADGKIPFEVWYLTRHGVEPSRDPEFGTTFNWDIETLSGYPYRFLDTAEGATPVTPWRCRLTERLRERIRSAGVTAVWIQGWQVAAYWQAVREAKAAGAEVWLRGESNDLAPTPAWKRPVKRALLGWLFGRVDRFFTIGSANKRLYRKFGATEVRLYAAPYAVDNARFARQAASLRSQRIEIRRAWGISDDAFCVLFCGKFIAKKRPIDLVEAARALRSTGRIPNVHLLFAGSGELRDTLLGACTPVFDSEAGGLGARRPISPDANPPASFAGFLNQTEISRAYVAADCLVLPSDPGETWGLVVNEALASGVPCLVSRACGCAEDLAPGDHSFALGDIAGLAEKLALVHAGKLPHPPLTLPSIADTVTAITQAARDLAAGSRTITK
jgi:glycosyltransferase involved in cell wall biosynthesis